MRKIVSIAALFVSAALMTAPVFAMSKVPEKLPAAAKGEVLRINCWVGYAAPYVDAFKALVKDKYNVDLTIEITNPTDQDEFYQAAKNGTADLISPPYELPKKPQFYAYDGADPLLQPVNPAHIPNIKHILPVFLHDTTTIFAGKRYGVPYNCGPYGLAYNADVVKNIPTSWNVMWDAKYKGKYTVNNNFPMVNIWITALSLGYTYDDIFDINNLDRVKIQGKLNTLARNAKSLWDGGANSDEFPELSLATTWGFAAQQANLKGGNWLLASPKEGGTAWVDSWYITSAAKGLTKRLAEEWINFMLSPENQAAVVKSQGVSPTVDNVGNFLSNKEKEMFHVGDNEYFKTVALWRVMSPETEKAFKEMWETATKGR
ncbi:MAG: ABC transporter substrate-binding protein [Desulfobacteraceae bacterium 4572_35.1]|nr:MAG: ABC transporter substrate-binding protein [Desulfobacteraceae bacterium 4572_35.1]